MGVGGGAVMAADDAAHVELDAFVDALVADEAGFVGVMDEVGVFGGVGVAGPFVGGADLVG